MNAAILDALATGPKDRVQLVSETGIPRTTVYVQLSHLQGFRFEHAHSHGVGNGSIRVRDESLPVLVKHGVEQLDVRPRGRPRVVYSLVGDQHGN